MHNERSFAVRRCVQLSLAGEITAQEAILRVLEHPMCATTITSERSAGSLDRHRRYVVRGLLKDPC